MKLKSKGLTMRYYAWFYGIKRNVLLREKNYCPIFWKLLVSWALFIIYVPFCLPAILVEKSSKSYENGDYNGGIRVILSAVIYAGLYLIFCLVLAITLFFIKYPKNSFLLNSAVRGILGWFIGIVSGIYYLIKYLIEKRRERKYRERETIYKEPNPNWFVEGVKALYNKYCPKIEWVDADPEENSENITS